MKKINTKHGGSEEKIWKGADPLFVGIHASLSEIWAGLLMALTLPCEFTPSTLLLIIYPGNIENDQ
jgi:hypothetical protein